MVPGSSSSSMESAAFTREDVLKLMEEKDKIEGDIASLLEVLEKNNNVGLNGPLIDADGFPRNDIDVYQVRHARHNIICLQNDHKALMLKIEQGLHAVHSQIKESGAVQDFEDDVGGDPFVRINVVAPGSPAATAGIQVEDQFVEFGSLNANNFTSLKDLAKVVQHSINTEIPIKVKRRTQFLQLKLIPKTWNGKGLLGCNVVPLENVER